MNAMEGRLPRPNVARAIIPAAVFRHILVVTHTTLPLPPSHATVLRRLPIHRRHRSRAEGRVLGGWGGDQVRTRLSFLSRGGSVACLECLGCALIGEGGGRGFWECFCARLVSLYVRVERRRCRRCVCYKRCFVSSTFFLFHYARGHFVVFRKFSYGTKPSSRKDVPNDVDWSPKSIASYIRQLNPAFSLLLCCWPREQQPLQGCHGRHYGQRETTCPVNVLE